MFERYIWFIFAESDSTDLEVDHFWSWPAEGGVVWNWYFWVCGGGRITCCCQASSLETSKYFLIPHSSNPSSPVLTVGGALCLFLFRESEHFNRSRWVVGSKRSSGLRAGVNRYAAVLCGKRSNDCRSYEGWSENAAFSPLPGFGLSDCCLLVSVSTVSCRKQQCLRLL